jgi:hypothetical protein
VVATQAAWERRRRVQAQQTMQTMGPTSGANSTALGLRVKEQKGRERGGSEEKIGDAEEVEVEADDVTMAES